MTQNPYRTRGQAGQVLHQSFARRAKRPRSSYFVHDSLHVPNTSLAEQTLGPDQEENVVHSTFSEESEDELDIAWPDRPSIGTTNDINILDDLAISGNDRQMSESTRDGCALPAYVPLLQRLQECTQVSN